MDGQAGEHYLVNGGILYFCIDEIVGTGTLEPGTYNSDYMKMISNALKAIDPSTMVYLYSNLYCGPATLKKYTELYGDVYTIEVTYAGETVRIVPLVSGIRVWGVA